MKPISLALALAAIYLFSLTSQAEPSDTPSQEDIMELKESVLNLEEQLQLIREDCQTLAESLNLQNSSDLEENLKLKNLLLKIASGEIPFSVENGAIRIGKDTKVYLGDYELTELLTCMAESETFKADDNRTVSSPSSDFSSVPTSLSTISYVTRQQYQVISDDVDSLESDAQSLKTEISALSSKIAAESGSIKELQSDSQSLASRIEKLEKQVAKDFESGLYMTDVNLVSGGKAPNIPPEQYIAASSWGSVASSFMVTEDSVLESVTLYFPSSAKAASVKQVYLTDIYNQNKTFPATRTGSGSYYTYKFNNGPNLECSKQYFIVLSGVIPYVCPAYRANGLYMPSTALLGVNAVASATSFWKNADERYEIWNEISFKKASFKIDQRGLNVIEGKLKVNNSEVVTKETICQDLINSITYDMFASPLKNMLLKTTGGNISGSLKVGGALAANSATVGGYDVITKKGGTITGPLTVNSSISATSAKVGGKPVITEGGGTMTGNLTVKGQVILPNNGAWKVGTQSSPSDLVMVGSSSRIRSENGNLNLAAPKGNIEAGSFLQHSLAQCGKVTITGESASVSVPGITEAAIVMLTPNNEPKQKYWYKVNKETSMLIIYRDEVGADNLSLDYFVIRK